MLKDMKLYLLEILLTLKDIEQLHQHKIHTLKVMKPMLQVLILMRRVVVLLLVEVVLMLKGEIQ